MEKILIIDDHKLVLEALGVLVAKRRTDFEVLTASNKTEALDSIKSDQGIKIVICDLNIDGKIEGFNIVKEGLVLNPSAKVIMLSMHSEKAFIKSAFSKGAHAYVLKTDSPDEIFKAIDAVLSEEQYCSSSVPNGILLEDSEIVELTQREQEIAHYVAAGLSSKKIAELLDISTRTVEVHRHSVMNKLNVSNVAQLVLALSSNDSSVAKKPLN